jgi:hypothetical protein
MPPDRARNAQERTAAARKDYVPGSPGDRARASRERKLKDVPDWRKLKVPKPRYVVLVGRTRIAVLVPGGEAQESTFEMVIGPYEAFKHAEAEAKRWTGPWQATVMALSAPGSVDLVGAE